MKRLLLLVIFSSISIFSTYAYHKKVPLSLDLIYYIVQECNRQKVSPALVFSIIDEESNYVVEAVNRRNPDGTTDHGLLQLNSEYIQWYIEKFGDPGVEYDPYNNPYHNVQLGIRYLAWLKGEMKGDTLKTLYCYNWGINRVKKAYRLGRSIPSDVIAYAERILTRIS